MKKNLLSNIGLESETFDAIADITGVIDSDTEGTALVNEIVSLESALDGVDSVVTAVALMEDKGIDAATIQDAMGPMAIAAIATIDESAAEETEIALEDDAGSFWQKVKAKAIEIWEAIKRRLMEFWSWLKGFFNKAGAQNEATKKVLDQEVKVLETVKLAIDKPQTETIKSEGKINLTRALVKTLLVIENRTTWAMQDHGWKARDLNSRLKHYAKNIVPFAKQLTAKTKEQTTLTKFELNKIKKSFDAATAEEILQTWEKRAEEMKSHYIGESKFINGTPVLIGYKRKVDVGYQPCEQADGEIVFDSIDDVIELASGLKAYGDASVGAIREMANIESYITDILKETESFIKGIDEKLGDDKEFINKLIALLRRSMFRTVDMVKEYTSSHGFKAQANGAKLIREVRIRLLAKNTEQ